jgi:hypothetical protein
MDLQHAAQRAHRMLPAMILDERVLHQDPLAKYAAAFFKMSRYSVTRLNSASSRLSLAACSSWASRFSPGIPTLDLWVRAPLRHPKPGCHKLDCKATLRDLSERFDLEFFGELLIAYDIS